MTDLCEYARPFYPPGYSSGIVFGNWSIPQQKILQIQVPRMPKNKPSNLNIEALETMKIISNPFDMPLIVNNIHKINNITNFSYFLN